MHIKYSKMDNASLSICGSAFSMGVRLMDKTLNLTSTIGKHATIVHNTTTVIILTVHYLMDK